MLAPAQVFGIGLNYREHAAESGVDAPDVPPVFTKFRSCLAGPYAAVELPSDRVDWEVELVAVIGLARNGYRRRRPGLTSRARW